MDKLQQTEQNLWRVLNSRCGCVHAMQLNCFETKLPSLKLKTRPKQPLDFLLSDIVLTSGLYYKPMMMVNGDSRVVTKLETSLTDDARVIIYGHHMFIVQGPMLFTNFRNKLECLCLASLSSLV